MWRAASFANSYFRSAPTKARFSSLAVTVVVPEPVKGIEGEVALACRGEQCPSHEPQGLLGRVVAVQLLYLGDGWNAPDGGDLSCGVGAVYKVG